MSDIKHSLWVEKYRPTTLDTYIGNEHLKSKVKVYLESGDLPHLLLFGKAGTGKTTLALVISYAVFGICCNAHWLRLMRRKDNFTKKLKMQRRHPKIKF